MKYIVYENKAVRLETFPIHEDSDVVFTSSIIFQYFKSHIANFDEWKKKGRAFTIGPMTTKTLMDDGVENIEESESATLQSLAELIDDED
ncbi:MAG: uroporphyrinogen-III synthase [Erysipelotrichaceae bacterium]